MPLTKGDKLIIIGAVVLALAVVAGLAAWRKPHLFTGGRATPEMTSRDFNVPAPAPAPTPQAETVSPPPTPAPKTGVSESAALPVPVPGAPAPAAAPTPQAPTAAAPPASPEIVATHPLFAGDQALDKMFSDMGQESAATKIDTGRKKPPEPAPVAPPPEPAPKAPEPAPKAEALDLPPAVPAKNPPKNAARKPGKPVVDAAPTVAATPSRGTVVAVSTADKPGEYVLTVTTSAPAGDVLRTYMDNPPRLVIDLLGRWTYTGPLSLSGKSPLIRLVRVGRHPDRLRLVLDLAPEAVSRLREAPVVDRNPNGVVIRLPK